MGACESVAVRVTLNGDNPDDIAGTARSQPCCEPGDVLYAYYETFEGEDIGRWTPGGSIVRNRPSVDHTTPPTAHSYTLTADPPDWTGDDMP